MLLRLRNNSETCVYIYNADYKQYMLKIEKRVFPPCRASRATCRVPLTRPLLRPTPSSRASRRSGGSRGGSGCQVFPRLHVLRATRGGLGLRVGCASAFAVPGTASGTVGGTAAVGWKNGAKTKSLEVEPPLF